MSDIIGKNTPNGEKLKSFIERIEQIDEQKKGLNEDRKLVVQEARSAGFNTGAMNYCLKVRKMKPHDRQEAETIRDLYLHALGMDPEPPLFRQIAALAPDMAARDTLIKAFSALVPPGSEIIVKSGGTPVRIWRDKHGEVHHEDYTPPGRVHESKPKRESAKKDVPDCNETEAYELGFSAAKENIPVIENPFPYGHANRPRWDEGWRAGSGNDGMGSD